MALDLEDRIVATTPEGVDLELILAGAGSRFAAGIIDVLAQGALFLLVAIGSALAGSVASAAGGDDLGIAAGGIGFALGGFAVFFGYHPFFEVRRAGRTPGKRRMGMQVVGADGHPIGFVQSAVRNVLRLVDQLPGTYLAGLACIFFTRTHQRLGDLAAGTLVVMEPGGLPKEPRRRGRRRARTAWAPGPPSDDAALRAAGLAVADVDGWDVSAVTPDELRIVRSFLHRRGDLTDEARHRLGWRFAEGLRPKVVGPPADLASEALLEGVAAAKLARS